MDKRTIMDRVQAERDNMIRERRYLHQHPELSGEEMETCAYIAAQLRGLGLEVHEVPPGGVIGLLGGHIRKPAILLRADIDALPIQESSRNLSCARTCISQVPGKMHACGHDAHTAMLLCAARILAEDPPDVPVLFVFEEGEENNSGILTLLPYLDAHFHIGACYATHVRWDIPAGQFGICPGTAMSGGFGFKIELRGRSGHGSRPDMAASPIDCFTQIHTRLMMLRMTEAEPDQVLTYSVGSVHAGQVTNIIPETLLFTGTVRTYDSARAGERFAAAMRAIVVETAASFGCEATFLHFPRLLYETSNDPVMRERFLSAVRTLVPEVQVEDVKPWMASETMSAYLKWWPGVLSFTGVRNEEKGCGAGHHTPEFDLDEDALATGVAAALAVVADWERSPAEVPDGFRGETLPSLLERKL
ncbi:MAG: amidohydrolase [Clostridia bacterium]|nr:amidohydrolase [Clostridia bacterium]